MSVSDTLNSNRTTGLYFGVLMKGYDLFFGDKTEDGAQQKGTIYISESNSLKSTIIRHVGLFGFCWYNSPRRMAAENARSARTMAGGFQGFAPRSPIGEEWINALFET